MDAQRIRAILNIYAELRAKGGMFKDVEPCYEEGNEYLVRLWTTQTFGGATGGTENPFPIDIPQVGTGDKGQGQGQGQGGGGDDQPQGGGGGGDDQPQGGGGGGDDQPQGGGGGGDDHPQGGGGEDEPPQPPPPSPIEPPQPEPETNPFEYQFKFPAITEMIYGVKVCNTTPDDVALSVENRLIIGIGLSICRALMAESGKVGESITATKKQTYIQILNSILGITQSRNIFSDDGSIIEENLEGDIDSLQSLILLDKLIYKSVPPMAIFNSSYFNQEQLDNAIDFCMTTFNENDSLLVTENYAESALPSTWGIILWRGMDKKNYDTHYYKYRLNVDRGGVKKTFDKQILTTVRKGKLEFSLDFNTVGQEFYSFVRTLIINYLNNTTQEFEIQNVAYKNTKALVLDSATSLFTTSIATIERLID